MEPVHPVLMLRGKKPKEAKGLTSLIRKRSHVMRNLRRHVRTCGNPVRMVERLGEQLLTEVKAFRKTTLRRARALRCGVRTTVLL